MNRKRSPQAKRQAMLVNALHSAAAELRSRFKRSRRAVDRRTAAVQLKALRQEYRRLNTASASKPFSLQTGSDVAWHRNYVGGLWETIGRLQFDFLVASGLKPSHSLLDVACGSLRGGVHCNRRRLRNLSEHSVYGPVVTSHGAAGVQLSE